LLDWRVEAGLDGLFGDWIENGGFAAAQQQQQAAFQAAQRTYSSLRRGQPGLRP